MLDRLRKAWKRQQSVMVQMPTGTGKTHLMAAVIRSLTHNHSPKGEGNSNQGGMVLVVAHRRELIEQISRTLDAFGIEHGLIVSGKPIDETKQVQVASIQTLVRRDLIPANAPTRSLSLFTFPCIYRRQLRMYRRIAQAVDQHPTLSNACLWAMGIAFMIEVFLYA